jgi:hypothetical protein
MYRARRSPSLSMSLQLIPAAEDVSNHKTCAHTRAAFTSLVLQAPDIANESEDDNIHPAAAVWTILVDNCKKLDNRFGSILDGRGGENHPELAKLVDTYLKTQNYADLSDVFRIGERFSGSASG